LPLKQKSLISKTSYSNLVKGLVFFRPGLQISQILGKRGDGDGHENMHPAMVFQPAHEF